MKASIIILAGAIGLAGCTGFHRAGDGRNEERPYTHTSKPEPPPRTTHIEPHTRPYIDLPEKAQNILNAVGIKDIVLVAAIEKNGTIRLLKPRNVTYREAKYPIDNVDILRPTPISIIPYKGSNCTLWSDGSGPDGPSKDAGEPLTIGGMRRDGIYCLY